MKSIYFLVRRDYRNILGPMDLAEFKASYKKMAFGGQDEVAGNLGPWIVIEKRQQLREHYPEIAKIVQELEPQHLVSSNLPTQIQPKGALKKDVPKKEERRGKPSQPKSSDGTRSSRFHPLFFLGTAIFFLGIGVSLLAKDYFLKGKDDSLTAFSELHILAKKDDPFEFLASLGAKMPMINAKLQRNKDSLNQWLPFLRMYAFYTSGTIDVLPHRTLRGIMLSPVGFDCTVENWKKKWPENATALFNLVGNGGKLSKAPWVQILLWDPHWMKRRQPKGWLKPKNYFEACIFTAATALKQLGTDAWNLQTASGMTAQVVYAISRRLQSQLEVIRGSSSYTGNERELSPLSVNTCVDLVDQPGLMPRCRTLVPSLDKEFLALIDEQISWASYRFLLRYAEFTSSGDWLKATADLLPETSFTKLDMKPELRLREWIAQGEQKIPLAVEKVEGEFPEIKFEVAGRGR